MEKPEEVRIDLDQLFSALRQQALLIGLTAVLWGLLTFWVTYFFVAPQYTASAKFYVNTHALSGENISSGDLTTSRDLVTSCIAILNTKESLNEVMQCAGRYYSVPELQGMITATAVDETELFQVSVTCSDPQEAAALAHAITQVLPQRIAGIIEGASAKVVETPSIPSKPSSPTWAKFTLIGSLAGLVFTAGLILLREIFDVRIRTEEDIAQVCGYPVLASVPVAESSHGEYIPPIPAEGHRDLAAAEAYTLLRAKLQFSFGSGSPGKVIAISGALRGEGKSVTSIHLAYALSELGKRVLLIDCDLRHPTIARKLRIGQTPGLSDYLAGQVEKKSLIHPWGIRASENGFAVIPAGQKPPNPIALLGSLRMQQLLQFFRNSYDYILLDLPPVGEVSDALAVAGEADGVLLVVRQKQCDRVTLGKVLRQFELINAPILGLVFHYTPEDDTEDDCEDDSADSSQHCEDDYIA